MKARKIAATSEQVDQHDTGSIVTVAFVGHYPPGSQGNECAMELVSYLRVVLATTNGAAVLIDLRRLEYRWGDGIGCLAWELRDGEASLHFRPSAIVATGLTARSLEPLLGPQFMLGVAGTKMFGTIPEALNHLKAALGREDR